VKLEPLIMYYPIKLDWLNLGLAFGASNACISYEQGVLERGILLEFKTRTY
jgi:hypothetical protein